MSEENTLSVKFTEEIYATKQDVSKTLNLSVIDPLWRNILNYREQYAQTLTLHNVSKRPYIIVYTPTVERKYRSFQKKLESATQRYDSFKVREVEYSRFRADFIKDILRNLAKSKGVTINEVVINNVIGGRNKDPNMDFLVTYYHAIENMEKNSVTHIDDNFFANYLLILSNQYELTSYYRTSDGESPKTRFVVNYQYNQGVPSIDIERMMNLLIDFVNSESTPLPVIAITAYFYFSYIKPFDKHNEELAMLLLKQIIARGNNEVLASILPFETLIGDEQAKLKEAIENVHAYHDITYLVIFALDTMEKVVAEFIDKMVVLEKQILQDSLYKSIDDESFKKEFNIEKSETRYAEAPKVEPEPTPEPQVVKEEVKPKVEAPKKVTKPSAPIMTTPLNNVSIAATEVQMRVLPSRLSEEEYAQLEADLLESDPFLRPQMAHFYVRHMKDGKYYTIQQYKRAEGCVYETARTAMDTLARRGYYRREQLKNKFVYTPMRRG